MQKKSRKSGDHAHTLFVIKVLAACLFVVYFSAVFLSLPSDDLEQPALPISTNNQTIRTRNQEVFEEYTRKHVLVKASRAVDCGAENMQLLLGDVLPENYMHRVNLKLTEAPQHYTLCLGDDSQQHTVTFTLEHGQCDILVSASGALPRKDFWDWKLNSRLSRKSLAIHTYSPEILRSNDRNLHIGIVSSSGGGACRVGVRVSSFSDEELLPKLGLRGGQVMLRRDLVH